MKHLMTAAVGVLLLAGPVSAGEQNERERSYTTSWQDGDTRFRSIMFPHEINGCKIMVQSRRWPADNGRGFVEKEGPDCNCDLVIDGFEGVFAQAQGYTAEKLLNVCQRPGIDGTSEKYDLMREGLKEEPQFTVKSQILGR